MTRRQSDWRTTLLVALCASAALGTACGDDEGRSDRPLVDGGRGLDAAPVDGGSTDDAGSPLDAGPADLGRDAGCVPQDVAVLCSGAGAQCGSVDVTDRCGDARTVECGGCLVGEACGLDAPNQCASEGWILTTIDAVGDAGRNVSMVIDASDGLHLAYQRGGSGISGDLRYAQLTDTGWVAETIDDSSIAGRATAIAIDGAGTIHVAAPAGSTSPLRAIDLWTKGDTGWTARMLPGGNTGRLGLTFDGSDRAHLCAYRPPGSGVGGFLLHFTEQPDGSFTSETVDGSVGTSSNKGDHCSIAFDGTELHIGYEDAQFLRLMHAVGTTGAWTVAPVDEPAGDTAGAHAAMVLDASGMPVIAYQAGSIGPSEIRLARLTSGGWAIATIDDAGHIANDTSLALDSAGMAHVSHFDAAAPGTMRYVEETPSGFVASVVAVNGTGTGGHNAIGVDSTDTVHIVFYDANTASLRHATPRP